MTVIEPTTSQCATCGVERTEATGVCPICDDERQYLPADGIQRWTSAAEQAAAGARLTLVEREPHLWGIRQEGGIGIGQEAKVIVTPAGNVLVDVPAFIDAQAVRAIEELGGIAAIVPTHPHMFGLQSSWSAAFDHAPVLVSEADAEWLGVKFPALHTWSGTVEPVPGVSASQPGGHFPGSSVVHFHGVDGAGVVLAGDTIVPVPDAGWVSFLRSYPNKIPLSAAVVRRIARHMSRYDFERLYNNFDDAPVARDARNVVQRSAERYAAWVSGDFDHLTGPG